MRIFVLALVVVIAVPGAIAIASGNGKGAIASDNGKGASAAAGKRGPRGAVGPQGAKGVTGATGPAGAVGAVGPAGPPGISAITRVQESFNLGGYELSLTSARCPNGYEVIGTGFDTDSGFTYPTSLLASGSSVTGTFYNSRAVGAQVTVQAICAQVGN